MAITKKRKSEGDAPIDQFFKKTKSSDTGASAGTGQALVKTILTNVTDPKSTEFPVALDDEDAIQDALVSVAMYARELETKLIAADGKKPGAKGASAAAAVKTPGQIQADADRVARTIASGIKKQMTWKTTCKQNRAKFSLDGVCPDPLVFGAVLGLNGPPDFKLKKFPSEEFEGNVGDITAHCRYNDLYITSDVSVRYNADTGEFKISGSYGVNRM